MENESSSSDVTEGQRVEDSDDEFGSDDDAPSIVPFRDSSDESSSSEEEEESEQPVRGFRQNIFDEELPEPERRFATYSSPVESEDETGNTIEDLDLAAEREFLEENRPEVRDLLDWTPEDSDGDGGVAAAHLHSEEEVDQVVGIENINSDMGEEMEDEDLEEGFENNNGDFMAELDRNNMNQRGQLENINAVHQGGIERPPRNRSRFAIHKNGQFIS